MTEKKQSFPAENYGEVIAIINGLNLISFEEDGGYAGDYLAILSDGERLFYYIDAYGSCPGCDWLEDVKNYTDEVPYEEAVNYVGDLKPKYIVPVNMPLKFESMGEYGGWKLTQEPTPEIPFFEGTMEKLDNITIRK
jgi:hypothetical protein